MRACVLVCVRACVCHNLHNIMYVRHDMYIKCTHYLLLCELRDVSSYLASPIAINIWS